MINVPAILLTGVFYTISKCIVEVVDILREIKRTEEEKTKIIELLKQETLNNEEQKNLIAILLQILDNDLINNSTTNQYLTNDNIMDFAKLKNKFENYRR